MFPEDILTLAGTVVDACRRHGVRLAAVESCTGGLVAAALTSIPGSSDVLDRGLVTYADAAKTELAHVPERLIAADGAVSESVARAMAAGGLVSDVDLSVAITGVAGPGGGTDAKPVGLVHFATDGRGGPHHQVRRFGDLGRAEVRMESVRVALEMLRDRLR